MKKILISFALAAATGMSILPASAQFSRKDYEPNENTTASANTNSDADDKDNTRSRKNYKRTERPNRNTRSTSTYKRSENRPNTTTTTYGKRTNRPTTDRRRPRATTTVRFGDYGNQNWGASRNARFQRQLEDRAIDLYEWKVDLDRREANLEGYRYREDRYARQNLLPSRRLTRGALNRWDDKLNRQEQRLSERERRIGRRERRWDRVGTSGNGYCPRP